MATSATAFLLLFLLAAATTTISGHRETELLLKAQAQVQQAKSWAENSAGRLSHGPAAGLTHSSSSSDQTGVAVRDCAKLYEESELRLTQMVTENSEKKKSIYSREDGLTWVSAVMTNHRTCLDGLEEKGYNNVEAQGLGKNLTMVLGEALALYAKNNSTGKGPPRGKISKSYGAILASWSQGSWKADLTVAQDGSGSHKTIREAVNAIAAMSENRRERVVIHVKEGVYNEKVEIGYKLKNVMLVGDGIDRTIVTGNRNFLQGSSTLGSATFDVSGDGFWARDMTFENTAGPEKQQAVALKVSSDLSVFYRCSFKAYQDTLFVHSNRQFYRDCLIYGTIDFIFGDASVVFQNCDILVRKPMSHQTNFITAQGRDDPNQPTGISIQNCRVRAASGLADDVKGSFKSYLGRPWKKYSRTVFMKTDLDGLIDPKGWSEWSGNFALSTLYYGEYMNTGNGASTQYRVNWPGFHVLSIPNEAKPFTVNEFLLGDQWIPATGVPFSAGI